MKYNMLIEKPIKTVQSFWVCIAFILASVFISSSSYAQGDLLLYPKRIVFEGGKRSQELNLANSGKDTARYVLSVVQIRMKDDGSFETITEPDPGQNFADKYFRIFPRNVVLPPNEAQTVKIQLTNTGEMLPGEYRSHLYVRAEEEKSPLGEEDNSNDGKSIEVKLKAVFGISIPVIIRTGETNSSVSISDISLVQPNDTLSTLKFTFKREGNMSAYGDVLVDYISPDGKKTKVAVANGLAVYTPTEKRYFNIGLAKIPGVDYKKGTLLVSYKYNSAKNEKIAEERLVLR